MPIHHSCDRLVSRRAVPMGTPILSQGFGTATASTFMHTIHNVIELYQAVLDVERYQLVRIADISTTQRYFGRNVYF